MPKYATRGIIFFIEQNIRGAWVVYGKEGVKQYYGYTKEQARQKYLKESRTIISEDWGDYMEYTNDTAKYINNKYLVILKDGSQHIYNGYTKDELVDTLHSQNITEADVYILT